MGVTATIAAVASLGYSVYSGEEGRKERKKGRDRTKMAREAKMAREGAAASKAAGREGQARRAKQLAMQRRVASMDTGAGNAPGQVAADVSSPAGGISKKLG